MVVASLAGSDGGLQWNTLLKCGGKRENSKFPKNVWGFHGPRSLSVVGNGSRSYLPLFATLNPRARATDLGQGPHLHRSVHAGLLRAPQPRARERPAGGRAKNSHVQKKSTRYVINSSNMYEVLYTSKYIKISCVYFVPGM